MDWKYKAAGKPSAPVFPANPDAFFLHRYIVNKQNRNKQL